MVKGLLCAISRPKLGCWRSDTSQSTKATICHATRKLDSAITRHFSTPGSPFSNNEVHSLIALGKESARSTRSVIMLFSFPLLMIHSSMPKPRSQCGSPLVHEGSQTDASLLLASADQLLRHIHTFFITPGHDRRQSRVALWTTPPSSALRFNSGLVASHHSRTSQADGRLQASAD